MLIHNWVCACRYSVHQLCSDLTAVVNLYPQKYVSLSPSVSPSLCISICVCVSVSVYAGMQLCLFNLNKIYVQLPTTTRQQRQAADKLKLAMTKADTDTHTQLQQCTHTQTGNIKCFKKCGTALKITCASGASFRPESLRVVLLGNLKAWVSWREFYARLPLPMKPFRQAFWLSKNTSGSTVYFLKLHPPTSSTTLLFVILVGVAVANIKCAQNKLKTNDAQAEAKGIVKKIVKKTGKEMFYNFCPLAFHLEFWRSSDFLQLPPLLHLPLFLCSPLENVASWRAFWPITHSEWPSGKTLVLTLAPAPALAMAMAMARQAQTWAWKRPNECRTFCDWAF